MALPPISSSTGVNRAISDSREALFDLQRQLATGKKVTTYGNLGQDRSKILSLRSELSQITGYQNTIKQVNIRLDVMQLSLDRMREVVSDVRSDAFAGGFELQPGGQTLYQLTTAGRFDEVISLLNTRVGDRYLVGGRQTEQPPVLSADDILNGNGAQAGFKQVAQERLQADLGTDGRGRLTLPAAAGAVVTLSEDTAAPHPFGFKLNAVVSNLTGTTVNGPAGAPVAIDATFTATLPQSGDTIEFTFDLPDGTQQDVTLTARSGAPTTPFEFEIGADENATAANFQAVLDTVIQSEAQGSLSAASAYAAADNFFDFDDATPPQRVAGPPYDTATALTDATAADTVFWYQGEVSSSSARQSALAKADDSLLVPYGARANEQAFATTMKSMAVMSVQTFSASDPSASQRYTEMRTRAVDTLSFQNGAQSIDSIITELTLSTTTLGAANERHDANTTLLDGFVTDTENADVFEISAQILALQGRIEASLQVSASLSGLSLVNFL